MFSSEEHYRRHAEEFAKKLQDFEMAATAPFVPGELEEWTGELYGQYERFKPLLARQIALLHQDEFADIAEADPEMFQRIDQMQQDDAAIMEEFHRIGERIQELRKLVPEVEPDETRLKQRLFAFVDDLIRFAVHVRGQEQEVRTWYLEAFVRDRGTVD